MERADATKDYSKKEAAAIAGCDERTIHRAIKADQLTARKESLPGGGEKTLIKGQDLNEWIDKREADRAPKQISKQPAALARQADSPPDNEQMRALLSIALENQKHINTLMTAPLHLTDGKKPRRQSVPMTERLTVTVTEAARLSGIPNAKAFIKEAIEQKRLKAIATQIKVAGKEAISYRIMQDDLKEWVKSLRG